MPSGAGRAEADFPGAKVYAGYNELLDDPAVDLVVIGTPHDTHMEMSIAASNREKARRRRQDHGDERRRGGPATIRAAEGKGRPAQCLSKPALDSDFLTVKEPSLEAGSASPT